MNNCINCQKETKSKYCSNTCQKEFEYLTYISNWKLGLEKGHVSKTKQISKHLRKYLLEKFNNACIVCDWNEVHPVDKKPLVEIDHIDGDASNCKEENLRVLCPNCHSMTPTFRARNKTSARNRS